MTGDTVSAFEVVLGIYVTVAAGILLAQWYRGGPGL